MRALSTGRGEHVDLSILETVNTTCTNYGDTMYRLMNGSPDDPRDPPFPGQTVETPSIEPTADGYVGFCTNTRQQFSDFLLMIQRLDLRDDEQLAQFAGRLMRWYAWNGIMADWLKAKSTEQVIEAASLLRIPVAPVLNGDTVQSHVQLKARGVLSPDASGRFVQPRRPYRVDERLSRGATGSAARCEYSDRVVRHQPTSVFRWCPREIAARWHSSAGPDRGRQGGVSA